MKYIIIILLFVGLDSAKAQTKFKIVSKETNTWRSIYSLIDLKNKTIRVLDSAQYYIAMNGFEYGYFAILGKKGSPGWSAIDANEDILFQVYNTSFGEPSPDYLIENRIRIIDENNKIGFANEKGQIVIKPQFEIVTSFHNGYAIIGENCKKIPWGGHESESNHYSIECRKYGYINDKGDIIKIGDFTFEQIMKKIKWKPDE